MTVSQLYESVAMLGFEDSLENDMRFIYAANRALLQVNSIRPATSSCQLVHNPLKNAIKGASFEPIEVCGEACFTAHSAKSYYFEAYGKGKLFIEKETENGYEPITPVSGIAFNSDKGFSGYRGLIKHYGYFVDSGIRLRFVGDYLFYVKNVAMYEHIFSENVEDIPAYEPYTRYDLSHILTDFLSLPAPPQVIKEDFVYINNGYDVEDGHVVLLPYSEKGIYKVTYNRVPKKIEAIGDPENDPIIDLEEDLGALLPILVASYVWLDDEPEKSQYYMNLYLERALDIGKKSYSTKPIHVTNVNGW